MISQSTIDEMKSVAEYNNRPKWVVGYNIFSEESNKYIGTGWEFFDEEDDAKKCYARQILAGNCPFVRPYHKTDVDNMGATHK